MTHPDPYIEDARILATDYAEYGLISVLGDKIISLVESTLKTQRIKDIEEIKKAIEEAPDENKGWTAIEIDFVLDLLTSRKAAIEEV